MPKIKSKPRPVSTSEITPIWETLVADLGDPRPYESAVVEFTDVATIVDGAGLDDLLTDVDDAHLDARSALDRAVEDAEVATVDLLSEGHATLDDVFPLDEVDDALEARARWRHAKLRRQETIVIPIWPGVDVVVDTETDTEVVAEIEESS